MRDDRLRRLLEVTVLGAGALLSAGCGQGRQPGTGSFSSNLYTSIAIADLNGDGNLDIASCYTVVSKGSNAHQGTVQVFLQDPAHRGKFLAPANYPDGNDPFMIAVADLNGDGKPDIAVADQGLPTTTTGVHVLLQDPSSPGTFEAPVDYANGSGSTELVIADIDGDGILDIAAASSPNVSVLFGSIALPGSFPTINNYPGNPGQAPFHQFRRRYFGWRWETSIATAGRI